MSHEIIGEDTRLIDSFSYPVFIINISGVIDKIGDTPPNMELVPSTGSIKGVMYRAKDDTAQQVIMNMTAHLKGDPQNTVYTYSVSEERIERILGGIQPSIIDVGTTWNITRIEKVNRTTILSGGQYGAGHPFTSTSQRTVNLTNLCVEKKRQAVPSGNFSTYKIRRTETDNPGNYSLYFLSPLIKREILLLEFTSRQSFIPYQSTELLGYTVTDAPLSLTALFTWSPKNPGINETVTLNGSRSVDPQGDIAEHSWSYTTLDVPHMPEQMGTGEILHYKWPQAGTYTITLKITNDKGSMDEKTQSLTIIENTPPVAIFTFTPANPRVDNLVTFDASSSHDPDGDIMNWT